MLGLVACGGQQAVNNSDVPPPNTATSMPTLSIPKDGSYNSKGRVTKINLKQGSIELDHEDIVGVMPAMLMEFNVRNKSILNGLKVGDNVDFVLEYKHPTETVISIKKIP